MRQGQNSKRSRGRGGGRRNASPRHQSFDSNGPSIRIRGNAHQVYEKYIQLARDANAAGDRVTAENMYQHAEHYFRIMNVDDGEQQRSQSRGNGSDQRHHGRNAQQGQDASPAVGIETGLRAEQSASAEKGDGVNGSGDGNGTGRGNGASAGRDVSDAQDRQEGGRQERQTRRPRRASGRSRTAPAETNDESTIVVESEVAAEPADTDAKDVH